MAEQRTLFDLEPPRLTPPGSVEHVPCISCGVLDEAYITEEAATFKETNAGLQTPEVIEHTHCPACGDDCLVERVQESPWIRAVWKLGPKPERSWRRNSRKRSTPRRR